MKVKSKIFAAKSFVNHHVKRPHYISKFTAHTWSFASVRMCIDDVRVVLVFIARYFEVAKEINFEVKRFGRKILTKWMKAASQWEEQRQAMSIKYWQWFRCKNWWHFNDKSLKLQLMNLNFMQTGACRLWRDAQRPGTESRRPHSWWQSRRFFKQSSVHQFRGGDFWWAESI